MARVVEITVPAERSGKLLGLLSEDDSIISLKLYRAASVRPRGDVIAVEVSNRDYHPLLKMLADEQIGATPATGLTASEPGAIYCRPRADALLRDVSEASPEEMEFSLAKEGNMTANGVALMLCGGSLATLGLSGGALELVIAAMVISPGLESLTRMGLGIVAGRGVARRGFWEMLKAYGALVVGAMATSLVLEALGKPVLGGNEFYFSSRALVQYWSSLSVLAVWSSGMAAIAGVVLTAAHRSILTAGVMVAFGLVPAGSLVGMSLVAGEWTLTGKALLRWLIEVALVILVSSLIFGWKRVRVHKRKMMI